ncbi:MAG: hypothetical protein AB8Z23_01275 [Coxiella-like endosymbiont]|nr:hypothetical protein [Coxiella-like endosymbiont]
MPIRGTFNDSAINYIIVGLVIEVATAGISRFPKLINYNRVQVCV